MVKPDDPPKLNVELSMVKGPGARLPAVMFRITWFRLFELYILNDTLLLIVVLLIELD
jgi:hypothetical protein